MIFKHHSLSPGSFSVEAEPTLFVVFSLLADSTSSLQLVPFRLRVTWHLSSATERKKTARKLHEIWGYFGDGDEDIQPACLVFQNSHRVMDRSDGQFNVSFESGKDRTGSGELVSGRSWEKKCWKCKGQKVLEMLRGKKATCNGCLAHRK